MVIINTVWLLSLILFISIVTTSSLPLHDIRNRKRENGELSRIIDEIARNRGKTSDTLSVEHPRETEHGEDLPERAQPCISIHYLLVLKNQFKNRIDPNDDGKATFDEVKEFLRHYQPNISSRTVAEFIQRRDLNGNGIIELIPEYILDITTPDYTQTGAREWFELEDTNGDGMVSGQELQTIARNVGMSPGEAADTVNSYYMSMDSNNDGNLSWDEYKALYRP